MGDAPFRTRRSTRRVLPWFIASALLATVGLPAVAGLGALPIVPEIGYAHPLGAHLNATVNMTDRPAYNPQFLSFPAGSAVSIHLVNQGTFPHTFTVCAKSDARIPSTLTPTELDAFFAANGTLANVSLNGGAQGWANFTFNSSQGFDSFEFASIVPYQFQAGMSGFINLTSTAPGLALSENTTDALQFVPNVLSASPTHYPVNLDVLVTNEGSFGHTFTLASQSNVTLQPTNFTDYFAAHAPLTNTPIPASPGQSAWANFTVTGPGVYQYICTISGHFQNGMFGFLYVGVPVPPPPPAPSTAIVEGWVLAGSAVLLGIGLVLLGASSLAGRFPSKPPTGHH